MLMSRSRGSAHMGAMNVTKKQLSEAARADIRTEMGWDKAQEWQYTEKPDTYTAEELERITALQAQWTALSEQGQKEGWLEWSGGYRDGEWELSENHVHPTRKVQVRETDEARSYRINNLMEEIEEKVTARVRKQWKALQDAQAIMDSVGK